MPERQSNQLFNERWKVNGIFPSRSRVHHRIMSKWPQTFHAYRNKNRLSFFFCWTKTHVWLIFSAVCQPMKRQSKEMKCNASFSYVTALLRKSYFRADEETLIRRNYKKQEQPTPLPLRAVTYNMSSVFARYESSPALHNDNIIIVATSPCLKKRGCRVASCCVKVKVK